MHQIRVANPEDAGVILQLIKDLALYEKEPEKVVCTVDDILRDSFSEPKRFDCLLAECDGHAVGFAVYYYKWSTWTGTRTLHLEDLFVKPVYRGRKIGFDLLQRLAKIAVDEKCDRFEWDVLDWNKLALDFYTSIGAVVKEGWLTCRMDGNALIELANVKRD